MNNDEIKQNLIQKYDEILRRATARRSSFLPQEPSKESAGHLLRQCVVSAQYNGLDKETEYLLVAVTALERYIELHQMLFHQLSIQPAPPVKIGDVTYEFKGSGK